MICFVNAHSIADSEDKQPIRHFGSSTQKKSYVFLLKNQRHQFILLEELPKKKKHCYLRDPAVVGFPSKLSSV
jgi:hypothetical protein